VFPISPARAPSTNGSGGRPARSPRTRSSSSSGSIVALWNRAQLAEDSGAEDAGGFGGIALAHNVGSPEAVDVIFAEARAAGASVTRPPAATFWGGYSGVFLDPDGHVWEIAHNPHWTLAADGSVTLGA
jgi:catechol 2,3-dioxygenase-like lactoylglutathione lyase family enzyme